MLDRWSWAQVTLAQECVVMAITTGLEMALSPLAQALGHEYKPGQVIAGQGRSSARRQPRATTVDATDPAAVARAEKRDAALLMAASKAGIAIEL